MTSRLKIISLAGICSMVLIGIQMLSGLVGITHMALPIIAFLAYMFNCILLSIYLNHIGAPNFPIILKLCHGIFTLLYMYCFIRRLIDFDMEDYPQKVYLTNIALWTSGSLSMVCDATSLILLYKRFNNRMLLYCLTIPRLGFYAIVVLSIFIGSNPLQILGIVAVLAGDLVFFWKLNTVNMRSNLKNDYEIDLLD